MSKNAHDNKRHAFPLKSGELKESLTFVFIWKQQLLNYRTFGYQTIEHEFSVHEGQENLANFIHKMFVLRNKAWLKGASEIYKLDYSINPDTASRPDLIGWLKYNPNNKDEIGDSTAYPDGYLRRLTKLLLYTHGDYTVNHGKANNDHSD